MNKTLLITSEAAEFLGIAQSTLRTYMQKKLLLPVGRKQGVRGNPSLFRLSDLENLKNLSNFTNPTNYTRRGRSAYRKLPDRKTEDEQHESGCIIHWSEFFRDKKSIAWIPITCASCDTKYNKREAGMKQSIKKDQFTGCCVNCYQSNRRPQKLKNNGQTIRDGYRFIHKRKFTKQEWNILKNMNPNNGIYIPEHRAIIALHLNRSLLPSESVHHVDGDKLNNAIDNLRLMNENEHSVFHSNHLKRESELMSEIKFLKNKIKELENQLEAK